ncbi:hypothetical protein [Vulcanococcus sp.]|uniref:hypothetical protein n=1 Tax=Vulcanococcus sp. TaxID=2856995 RepID=UPI003F69E349
MSLRQSMLARALFIAVAAIPEQGWAAQRLRIKPRPHRMLWHLPGLNSAVGLKGHAHAVMVLLKRSEQPVGMVLHDPLMGMA